MKKLLTILFLMLMAFVIVMPVLAETFEAIPTEVVVDTAPTAQVVTEEPMPDPTVGPWTWGYLATIAGATAATLLIVQFMKVPLDKVWRIPTRLFVYIIAFIILTVATAFTATLSPNTFLLCVLNAFIVALTAYGAYEVSFAKLDRN